MGNVGQLACDLLISTFNLEKVGYYSPELFIPVAGYNAFDEGNMELTINSEGELVLII